MILPNSSALTDAELPAPQVRATAHARPRLRFGLNELVAALLALLSFIIAFTARVGYDYWWQIADGRYIVAHRALPIPDRFSFTAAGRHWVDHEWLAEIAMYGLHRAFGVAGPLALYGGCMATTVLLVISALRRLGVRMLPAATWTLLLIAALMPHTGARPQAAAFLLFAAVLWLLERWAVRHDRTIWALPALFWMWGNVHGSFVVGMAVPALLLVGETLTAHLQGPVRVRLGSRERRRLAIALGLSVAVLLANPNGVALLLYPLTKLPNPLLQYLGEWNAADISDPRIWPFAVLAGGYVALVAVRRPFLPAADLLTTAAFTAGGLWSIRFVPFAAIALAVFAGRVLTQPDRSGITLPSFVRALAAWREERSHRRTHSSAAQQGLNLVLLVIVIALTAATLRPYDAAHDPDLPVAAVDALGAQGLSGPVFHDYNWGGYLIWRLWPELRVFADGRGDMYISGGEFRDYLDVVFLKSRADIVLDKYDVATVLFPRDAALTRYLLAGGAWHATYDDGQVVRLERTTATRGR